MTVRKPGQFLFAGGDRGGLTKRQYARLVQEWVASIGLDAAKFGTHSLRRTKAVLIYRRTGNQRHVALGWWKPENEDEGPLKVFDGQHKAAAQILLGVKELPVRVFVEPDLKVLAEPISIQKIIAA